MSDKTDRKKTTAQDCLIEGGRKGGQAEKQFTPESKQRQREGARRGGQKGGRMPKHFSPESKRRQIEGARRGGCNSHLRDADG